MQSFPQPLSAAQETVYLRQYQNGDMHARDILIERNLRLVAHIVKKYMNSGKETDEMISVGIVGLVKAVNTYNFEKGSRLQPMLPGVSTMNCSCSCAAIENFPGRSPFMIPSAQTKKATKSRFSVFLSMRMKISSTSWIKNSLSGRCQKFFPKF